MGATQRVYRERIRSTQSLKKIFRAMELIAASRIGKARERVGAASPYSKAITRAIEAVAEHASVEHPLTTERTDTNRVALLVVTADRGMAGAYTANALRSSERLREQLMEQGKEVVQYVAGRRGVSYFSFRHRHVAGQWIGSSDAPPLKMAQDIARALLAAFLAPADEGGVAEIHIVYTRYRSMVYQESRLIRALPLRVVERAFGKGDTLSPLYDFEPSAEEVLDALLPRYIEARVYSHLLQSAASELAARQRAMNTATSNAEDMILNHTRRANAARQSEITQEISEIVSGADALAAS
jgi:F-type H+-transporting ATPase subunit gamma